MNDTSTSRRHSVRTRVIALSAVAVLPTALVVLAPTVADAKTAANTFTFKGAYSGTLTLTPSIGDCLYSKSYDGKSYLVNLSHMKGTIKGVGAGTWALAIHVPKMGTTHVASEDVHSYTDTSFQNNGAPLTSFIEMSGTVTDNGTTGSVSLTVEHHVIGTMVYKGIATVTGSWNCPQALNGG